MNPHVKQPSSPTYMLCSIWNHRHLIQQMTWREVMGRYKGSVFGLAWTFVNPLMMLGVYTFVFSVIFKARWGLEGPESKANFSLVLFIGLIIHALLAEVLNRSPSIILSNTNYVKKVVFPLEVLTVVGVGAALFQAMISIVVFLIVFIFLIGFPSWTAMYTPITLLPLLPLVLGLGWFITSLGVYLRDVGQVIGVITTMLLFLAPVFYPLTAMPEKFQFILRINPLTLPIEQTRAVIIFGQTPDWTSLAIYTVISITVCWLGFWWFQKTRKGFADVI